jgi:hypothetical protein
MGVGVAVAVGQEMHHTAATGGPSLSLQLTGAWFARLQKLDSYWSAAIVSRQRRASNPLHLDHPRLSKNGESIRSILVLLWGTYS